MPADEDYGRRQITSLQHASSSPAPVPCPAGCPAAPAPNYALQQERAANNPTSERYVGGDKGLPPDRFEPPDRFQSVAERFGSERSSSDRLPSGERYQGISERYPLGEQPRTSVSSERLVPKEILQTSGHCQADRQNFQPERYQYTARDDRTSNQRYSERFVPIQNIGSLDRYHNHGTIDRYSRTNTPTDRYHTSSTDKERCSSNNNDRYTSVEKYPNTIDAFGTNDRHASTPSVCSIERYTPTERYRNAQGDAQTKDMHKHRERSASSERKCDRYQHGGDRYQTRYGNEQYVQERYSGERFPPIPCPERFATREERPFTQVPYMEPPSPAPASDRFIPPPPLSPENTPSPDCYPSNPFPSPTATVQTQERFIPPPPLSPSPTETFSPKKMDRRDRYQERYTTSPNPNDRFAQYHRNQYYGSEHANFHHSDKYVSDRYGGGGGERYLPPNAHMPVERYVPQPQEQYYGTYQSYDRFAKFNNGDPYMRRDLRYQYRLPVPYPQNQYQRIRYMGNGNRVKCCQYQEGYQLSKSSPGSSSSSSVTSQGKEIQSFHSNAAGVNATSLQDVMQCQNYQGKEFQCGYQQPQQEKAVQCSHYQGKELQCGAGGGYHGAAVAGKDSKECIGFVSPNLRNAKGQCRHGMCASPSVEYVGQSGGRHVCATPPPRGSIGSGDGSVCSDQCCGRRSQSTLAVTVWRTTPPQPAQQQQQQQQQQQPQGLIAEQQPPTTEATEDSPPENNENQEKISSSSPVIQRPPPVQRAVSMPAPSSHSERYRTTTSGNGQQQPVNVNYTQSDRIPTQKPRFARSTSRGEAIKNFIKKETANFFGVDEESEGDQQLRWLDRRKRLACRTYGPLKEEYRAPSGRTLRRAVSEVVGSAAPGRYLYTGRPDVLPGPSDIPDGGPDRPDRLIFDSAGIRRKDSVAQMTWGGLSYVVTTLTRHRPRPRSQQAQLSRSYLPDTPSTSAVLDDDVFFDRRSTPATPASVELGSGDQPEEERVLQPLDSVPPMARYGVRSGPGWKRVPHGRGINQEEQGRPNVGCSRIFSSMLDSVLDNSDRRQYGMGWVGRLFGRSMRRSVAQDDDIKQQLDDMEDHRPLFTYWVTTVQILVLIISLICYGFGPFGIDLQSRSGQVLVTSLSLQQVDYMEPANFWFGPRAADLIHLGAKFAPCMRVDNKIIQQIEKTRSKERETACCIRNDDSGCVQSSQADCSKTISTWKKWSAGDAGPGGRISGSVCGLDPKFCDAPASVHPYEWPDDITKWPICRKTNTQYSIQKKIPRDKLAEHMVCEVIGHPCCIGIHGQCRITTREYCDFVHGTFHEEASLCSQVSCLNDVCGMIPFYFPETPDQFYRLWTSIFLHAGILQLVITILIQYFLMRDLEKLTGSLRIGIIYIGSGVAGNLASAIFVPYRADVGPAGCQFGLLACLIVEVLNAWPMLKHPNQSLCKLLSITLFLFFVGLLPWVDNYAHLFGFVFGFLLSYALLPFISFGKYDRQKKVVLIWVCLLSASFLFICLVLLFYIIPVYDCKICSYFNCLPLTRDFCASQNINFKREEPVV